MFSFIKELGKIDVEYKYDDSDDNNNVFKSYIKSVETEYILIDFLFYKGAEYNIPNEKQITVKFKEKLGIYSGVCKILGRDNSRIPGIKISYPDAIKFIQRREYVRVPLSLKVELSIFPEKEDDEINVCVVNSLDISGSGFCCISDRPTEKHSKIIGKVYLLNSNEEPVEVLVKHVHSKKIIAAGKNKYKNAFTFIEINEKSRDKIIKEIFLYELKLRKKGI